MAPLPGAQCERGARRHAIRCWRMGTAGNDAPDQISPARDERHRPKDIESFEAACGIEREERAQHSGNDSGDERPKARLPGGRWLQPQRDEVAAMPKKNTAMAPDVSSSESGR